MDLKKPVIGIVGTGYVGLVTGVCLADFGHHVIAADKDTEKIRMLKNGVSPIYESGLDEMLRNVLNKGLIEFTSNLSELIARSDVVFIAVGTPSRRDGSADLKSVFNVAEAIAEHMRDYKIVVLKSTVPVGTTRKVEEFISTKLQERGIDIEFDVVSNPEFLREGNAVYDFLHPDRVVIGTRAERPIEVMRYIYKPLKLIDVPFVFTTPETAELIKYASNAFLAMKISFINEIANLCDKVGADVHVVAKAMGMDGRISPKFLHPGPGYGGSCFPKDTRALASVAKEHGIKLGLVEATIEANERQKMRMVEKIEERMGDLQGKTIAVLGLTFKANTDDVRESPALTIVPELVKRGARVRAYDPMGMENAKKLLGEKDIKYCADEYEAAEEADAVVILTEWFVFRRMDLTKLREVMRNYYFFDFRNLYEPDEVKKAGFVYEGVGRG